MFLRGTLAIYARTITALCFDLSIQFRVGSTRLALAKIATPNAAIQLSAAIAVNAWVRNLLRRLKK
jgi:hypothetical protein